MYNLFMTNLYILHLYDIFILINYLPFIDNYLYL